jgi:hypothetical protein
MRKIVIVMLTAVLGTVLWAPTPAQADAPEGQGCCSHHKGVCGCSGGRSLCCDNTLSPSCGC